MQIRFFRSPSKPEEVWSWFFAISVIAALIFCLAFWAVGHVALEFTDDQIKMLMTLGNAGITIAVVGILGGWVKYLFDTLNSGREEALAKAAKKRDETVARYEFVRALLSDIKSVYDIVERARLLVEAHKSAKTYGEQMRNLPNAQVILHNMRRALRPDIDEVGNDIDNQLRAASNFVRALLDEFQESYLRASILQSEYEARKKRHMTSIEEGKTPEDPVSELDQPVWEFLSGLTELETLRAADDEAFKYYELRFLNHIDAASYKLRRRLPGGEETDPKEEEKHEQSQEFFRRLRPKAGEWRNGREVAKELASLAAKKTAAL